MSTCSETNKKYYQENRIEITIKRKKFYQNNVERMKLNQKRYYLKNREEICERQKEYQKKYRQDNKEKTRISNEKYIRTEQGFFRSMWRSCKKSKHGCGFKDFNEFFNCWLEQKAVSGMICPATGVEMTMEPGKGLKRHFTNVSKDRILSTRSYSKENLIFTTYGFNSSKCNLSPKGAKAFLRIVKERYGTDEIE